MKNFLNSYFKYFILAALIYMPIFGFLDTIPIRIWDEARQAINAYEMLNNGNYLVIYYKGKPDMWNSKPPLLIWIQAAFMGIIGVNELAVRLPSAFAVLFTCIALMLFSFKYFKNHWYGIVAVLVLITSNGIIGDHAGRTGDYDALLTLFTTLSGLSFFSYCETRNQKFLYFFFIATTLAVLTKSISGLLFLPAIFIYSLISKQFLPLFKNKHFYFGLFIFIFGVVGYYLLREIQNPGYLRAVHENELGGRFLETIENHKHGFWYYYDNIVSGRLAYWVFFLPCGILMGLFSKNNKVFKVSLFSGLMTLCYFLVISSAQTKLAWYDVPLYPFFAIHISVFVVFLIQFFENNEWIKQSVKPAVISVIVVFFIVINPYKAIVDKTYKPTELAWDKDFYDIGYYLKNAIKGTYDLNGTFLLYEDDNGHNRFYVNILQDKGVDFSFKNWEDLETNDIVIANQSHIKQYLSEHYQIEQLSEVNTVTKYLIHGKK